MADITKIAAFVGKVTKAVDLTASGTVFKPYDLEVQNQFSFNGGTTALTSAILETLIDGTQDASTLHNHDGRYFTQTQLGGHTTGTGAELIGLEDKVYSNITGGSPTSGKTLQDIIEDINTALATAGGTTFADSAFGITNSGNTLSFDASGLTTDRSITMPDANVDLGDIASNNASRHDALTLGGSANDTTDDTLDLTGQVLTVNLATSSTDGAMSSTDKTKLDAISGTNTGDQDASSTPFSADGDITSTNVQTAIVEVRDDTDTKLTGKLTISSPETLGGNLSLGGNKVTGLGTPTVDTDAATKGYVDSSLNGIKWKDSVRAHSTSNISDLSAGAPQTVDGVTLQDGDRVLVSGQTTKSENGIYDVTTAGTGSNGVWARASDLDTGDQAASTAVFIEEGTAYEDTGWTCTADQSADTVGTHDLDWVQFTGAGSIIAGVGLAKSGNALSVNLGAGIKELPTDEVGIDPYATGGLFTTVDGSTESTATGAQLSIKIDGSTLSLGASGLSVGTITSSELGTDSVTSAAIGAGEVGTTELATDAVSTVKIENDAVDKDKIASDVAGLGMNQHTDGSLDSTGAIITLSNSTGAAIAANEMVNIKSDGSIEKASADAIATAQGTIGVTAESIADSASGRVYIAGLATVKPVDGSGSATSLTVGQAVFLSKGVAGAVTQLDTGGEQSTTGDAILEVGIATAATQIAVKIGQMIEVE